MAKRSAAMRACGVKFFELSSSERMTETRTLRLEAPIEVDCLVLGGGITGAGIARDAALRGLRVLLVDSNDFASGTSHLTSKLIHGGLRYLEHGHLRLVLEAVLERDRLLNKMAPTLAWPMRFVIPFQTREVPKWLITLGGLQVYGFMERVRRGRQSSPLMARHLARNYPLLRRHAFAVSFWDAQTNDARLVLSTLRTASRGGALLRNYSRIEEAIPGEDGWRITLASDVAGRSVSTVRANTVVNATGPWSTRTAETLGAPATDVIGVKGSHIVLRRPERFGEDAIVIRSVCDDRPLWVVPWLGRVLVGSTESAFRGDPRDARATSAEVDDLFESFQRFFPAAHATRGDILCAFAGVRPILAQDGESENAMSREHRVDVDIRQRLITVSGGKLTTFRKMAEQAVDRVSDLLGLNEIGLTTRAKLRNEPLWPGLKRGEVHALEHVLHERGQLGAVADSQLRHLIRQYGSDAVEIVESAVHDPQLAEPIFPSLPYSLAEVDWICRHEWVQHLSDVVKRRLPLYFLADDWDSPWVTAVADRAAAALGWSAERRRTELALLADEVRADHAAIRDFGRLGWETETTAACA